MKEVILDAELRTVATKNHLKSIRNEGKVPGTFYGVGEKAMSLIVNLKQFEKLMHEHGGGNVLVNLKFTNENKTAIVKEVQRDIIKQTPIHVDFQAVSLKDKIVVNVPLRITGEAPGVKVGGGILEHLLREVHVRCLPMDIPDFITVDVSRLEVNHSVLVKDLAPVEGVEVTSDPQAIILSIVAPTELEEAPAAGAAVAAVGAAAEPEVISKGKKEKEEGEAAPAAGKDKKAEPKAAEAKK
ncbi:MAG: hypothetical protein A2219_08330 [Elusimicrobia bacterium RIFOXYA2_FULL_50_26]|nr:MAG: hypothetical protein A2219_08330 [Elusimicrobia bacterium RIFOXYA2_FULL_50_26]OGS22331.1 MAG: hypothetical protein A2314_08725 [Elusimicrobia bacterium RIFOXYB2_FULL_50_12]